MKKVTRALSILMTMILAAGTAGCGGNNTSSTSTEISSTGGSNTSSSTPSSTAKTDSPEIEIWVGKVRDFSEITKVQEQWKEKLGFNTRVKNVTGDVSTALNLVISSGGFKDIAVIPKNDIYNNTITRSGTVMEVTDILKDTSRPNISSIPQPYLDVSADKDGKFWYIPSEWDVSVDDPWPGWTWGAFLVREDLLKELGMQKTDIKTLADYENYLYKVKELKTPAGEPIIPITYVNGDNPANINIPLTAFGVKTGRASGAVTSVDKVGEEYQFMYDNPNYKKCFEWLNKLVREGLMDEESVVQKADVCKQKMYNGMYGASMGRPDYNQGKPGDIVYQYEIIPFPLPEGVEEPGQQYVTNPYPKSAVYISKNTKNLDAVLEFMDWALDKDPKRNFELNEGLEGIFWNWTDKPYGEWDFDPQYEEERNNPATHANLQPELYMLGTMSKEWYPWWTQKPKEGGGVGVDVRHCYEIAEYGTRENIHTWDMVRSEQGSKWEKYGPTLNQVVTEATPKLILAESEAEFEKEWTSFMKSMEEKAHWSELKTEWHELYKKQIAVTGEW